MNLHIDAEDLVSAFGRQLLGVRVFVLEPRGEVPAGWATIRQVVPDKEEPTIVLQVTQDNYGSIGVFDNERLMVPIKKGKRPGQFQLLHAVPSKRKARKA